MQARQAPPIQSARGAACTLSYLQVTPLKQVFDNMCFDSQVSFPEFLLLSFIPYHPLLTKISFIFSNLYYKACRPASKTGQWVKPLAAKPDELNSIPRTQVEGENQFQEVVPDLHVHAGAYVCAHTHICECKKKILAETSWICI